MPFIPHTDTEIKKMLEAIGVSSIQDLFREIPETLFTSDWSTIPDGLSENELLRLMQKRAAKDHTELNFIGAGAYEHHIPAFIWDLASRGEWMTAYTPYQAEASQGTLQLLYEYQSMMRELMKMEVSNASLYDGASATAEAVLMAIRVHASKHSLSTENTSKKIKILLPRALHPFYKQVLDTIVTVQNVELIEIPFNQEGRIETESLKTFHNQNVAAIILPCPNFFGVLEEVDFLSNWAHQENALVIAVVNPLAMGLLKPPGLWGENGADIACGEGQPLGIPLASGGPYFGFFTCKSSYIRQLPGRLVGKTTDRLGRIGFTLTLQAREQHIRRAKATSNICTNQGLLILVATLYLCIMGGQGLKQTALHCHVAAAHLQNKLNKIKGIRFPFGSSPFFHEFVVKLPEVCSVTDVLTELAHEGIQGGLNLESYYPELKNCLLIAVTETKTEQDLDFFVSRLQHLLQTALHKDHDNANL